MGQVRGGVGEVAVLFKYAFQCKEITLFHCIAFEYLSFILKLPKVHF